MPNKPKVLILYDYYVPAYKAGGPVQSLANLVELLGDEVDFYVLTGATDLHEINPMANIKTDEWVQVGKTQVYYATRKSSSVVNRMISFLDPGIIYLNGMFSIPFMVYPVMQYSHRKKLILAPRGMLAPAALKIKRWKKIPYLFLLRLLGLSKKVIFHATKTAEINEIREHFSKYCLIKTIGNVPASPQSSSVIHSRPSGSLRLYMVSRISPEKNVHYIFKVLKKYQSNQKLDLSIIGNPENEAYMRNCRDLATELPDSISIDWTGHLAQPEIMGRVNNYDVFISPTLGENFGHAIFEALGAGKPVLISNRTPWHGLEEANAGFELSLDDPDVWLEKINYFAGMEEKTYAEWSRGAWGYARKYYDQLELKKHYLEMFSV